MQNFETIYNNLLHLLDNTKSYDKINEIETLQNILLACNSYNIKAKKLYNEIEYFKNNILAMYYNKKAYNKAMSTYNDIIDNLNITKKLYNNTIIEYNYNTKYLIK